MYNVNEDYDYLRRFRKANKAQKKVSIWESKGFDLLTSWLLILASTALTVAILMTM